MGGVEPAFQGLEIIVRLVVLGDVAVCFRRSHPFEIGRGGLAFRRPHIGPDHPGLLDRGVRLDAHILPYSCVLWHAGKIDTSSVDVEFPAVIDAAQSVLFCCGRNNDARWCGRTRPLARILPSVLGRRRDLRRGCGPELAASRAPSIPMTARPVANTCASASPWACPGRREPAAHCLHVSASIVLAVGKGQGVLIRSLGSIATNVKPILRPPLVAKIKEPKKVLSTKGRHAALQPSRYSVVMLATARSINCFGVA